ncbi:hypothetical protein BJX65DRAFT_234229 [Aspergillus insuetus]
MCWMLKWAEVHCKISIFPCLAIMRSCANKTNSLQSYIPERMEHQYAYADNSRHHLMLLFAVSIDITDEIYISSHSRVIAASGVNVASPPPSTRKTIALPSFSYLLSRTFPILLIRTCRIKPATPHQEPRAFFKQASGNSCTPEGMPSALLLLSSAAEKSG